MTTSISGTSGITFPNGSSQDVGAVGVGQTWQNVTASRASGTTYTNNTGKPIMVAIAPNVSGMTVICQGVTLAATGNNAGFSFMVPVGATYSATGTFNSWCELR